MPSPDWFPFFICQGEAAGSYRKKLSPDVKGGHLMPILPKLQEYLEQHHVQYEVKTHWTTYTAQEVAAAEHISGKDVAKVVMIKCADGAPMMLVLPASHRVDFSHLAETLGTRAELEQEREFRTLFPDCEVGAEPPFGNLFAVDMLVDKALTEDSDIVFNAGTHQDSVRMRYHDFAQLVQPPVAEFARHM